MCEPCLNFYMRFRFKAIKNTTVIVRDIEASNEEAVLSYLKENDLAPVEIRNLSGMQFGFLSGMFEKVSFNDIVDFTRQIAIMLNAGLTIIDSLEILKRQVTKQGLLKIIEGIDKEIKGGSTFSASLQKYPDLFPNLYISLVKSGEASGKLSDILLRLAENLEKQREFKGKLKGALIYPVIVVVGMLSVMFIMVTFVVPRLLTLYNDFDIELPLSTKILVAISSFSANFWPIILGVVFAGVYMIRRYLKTATGKFLFDSVLMKLPVIGSVVKISSLVDATRTLSVLIGSGVSILDGLKIIIETTENSIFQKAFSSIYNRVQKGESLGNSLAKEGVFPPILVQMTIVGENTGKLDDTLMRLSKYFEMESEIAIKAMTTLIEPLILVFLGVGVGFLVFSVITPIYNLTSSFK